MGIILQEQQFAEELQLSGISSTYTYLLVSLENHRKIIDYDEVKNILFTMWNKTTDSQ